MNFVRLCGILVLCLFAGCSGEVNEHYYLEAKKTEVGPEMTMTITYVRRYEQEKWCISEKESLISEGDFQAECSFENLTYKAMFNEEAVGKWYAIQRVGAFPPSIVFYDFDPPLPDSVMLDNLRRSAPHILQFAALHQAPAEVSIFSPHGENVSLN